MSHPASRDERVEFVVDTEDLADQLERRGLHGVHVGDCVRLELIHGEGGGERPDRPPSWMGSFHSGHGDLEGRAGKITRNELGDTK